MSRRKALEKGWFKIPGVQDGDRTLSQQLTGLAPVVAEIRGKRLLDLGCAEGLVSKHMLQYGAREATCVDVWPRAINVARQQLAGLPATLWCMDLNNAAFPQPVEADVVLLLAILHKLREPAKLLALAARSCTDLIVVRLPRGSSGIIVDARSGNVPFDVVAALREAGFAEDRRERGPLDEVTVYFRRGHR